MGDKRTDPGQYYPGGKVVSQHGVAPPQIIVQWSDVQGKPQIAPLPDRYSDGDMKGKINEIASKLATVIVAALIGWTACADVTVQKKRKDQIYNDELVVVDVSGEDGGVDTNAVRDIIRDEITPATNRLNQTLSDALDDKRDKDDRAVYKLVKSAFVLHKDGLTDVTLPFIGKDQSKPYPYNEYDWVYKFSGAFHSIVFSDGRWKLNIDDGGEYGYSPASEDALRIEFDNGYVATRSSIISTVPVDDQQLAAVATDNTLKPSDGDLVKYDATNDRFVKATASDIPELPYLSTENGGIVDGFVLFSRLVVFNSEIQPATVRAMAGDVIATVDGNIHNLSYKADRATTLSGYGITDGATKTELADRYTIKSETFTNDVSAVVTNDVERWAIFGTPKAQSYYWIYFDRDLSIAFLKDGNEDVSECPYAQGVKTLRFTNSYYIGPIDITARLLTENALGLAYSKDIPAISATDSTFSNAVLAVTTNTILREVSSALNTYVDDETGVEYVGKFYGGSLYYIPTGNVYPPNN